MYLKRFNLYKITGQLLPVYPIYVLLFQYKGLSLSAISGLLIIWSVPGLVLEVPSSLLADRWNRRNILVVGKAFKGLCFIIWVFSNSFFGFALGFLLWGAGGSLTSGTEEAWLYDALKSSSNENNFDRIWGKSIFYSQISVGISSVIGSLLATISMYLTLWISVAFIIISIILAISLPEYNHMRNGDTQTSWKNYFSLLNEGIRFCLTYKSIPILIGFSATVLITAGVIDEYDQLIVRSMGVPLGLVGIWLLLRYGMEALGGHVAWRFKGLFIKLGIIKPFSMQLYFAVLSGVLLGLSAFYPLIILLPLYGGYYFVMSCAKVLLTDALQEAIENQGRATVQSLASMLEIPGGMLIYAIFGAVGGFKYLQGAMIAVTIWIFGLSFLFWVIQDKIDKYKT